MASVLLLALGALELGCFHAPYARGSFIATQDFAEYEEIGPVVRGSSCTWYFGIGQRSLERAYADAIEDSPDGTTGLAMAKFTESSPMLIVHLLGEPACVKVIGTPARVSP